MDALALLCTLHADGPTTLRRLRDAGCTSLDDLGRVGAERVAEVIGISPAASRRFLRESSRLVERIGPSALDPEESMHPAAAPAGAEDPAVLTPVTPAAERGLDRTDRRVLQRVIERWREEEERDAAAAPLKPVEPPLTPADALHFGAGTDMGARQQAAAEVLPTPRTPPTPLEPGVIDGLDGPSCAALVAAGCATQDALAGADALELARCAGLPYTQVRRLQFLTQRELAARTSTGAPPLDATRESAPATVSAQWSHDTAPALERLSPSVSAALPADDATPEGAAGPFA